MHGRAPRRHTSRRGDRRPLARLPGRIGRRVAGVRDSHVGSRVIREPMHLHFLCNTLHLLQGLVHRDPDRVERMLDELCDLLQHLLLSTRVPDVPLRDELSALQAYASLQKLRFDERLDVDFQVDPAILDRRVPGFVLYPLLENAVKFGMQTGPSPARVVVTVRRHGEGVELDVANTGRWVDDAGEHDPAQGAHLALDSVRERLQVIFPGRDLLTVRERDGWVRATLRVPPAARVMPRAATASA